jgi:DNA-binding winged helix-turn-helix (wHTH) protein/TolB-like protein/Tfp pilus assembly protein PilF
VTRDGELYEFGPFLLDTAEQQLLRDGQLVPLTGKAFEVLSLLVRNSGRTITKEEFMAEVWPGTVVEEGNLSDKISTLRQFLGDDAREPVYIRTIQRRGYRFVAEVREVASTGSLPVAETAPPLAPVESSRPSPHPAPRTRSRVWTAGLLALAVAVVALAIWMSRRAKPSGETTTGDVRTLAVLPFKPFAAADRDPAMEIGMADALIAKLSGIRDLRVRSTTAVMPYARGNVDILEIAEKLDVDSVLDGKVQKIGERVRVSVQLIRASDGATIWGDRFDERFTDIFALQDAISQRVAAALAVRLTSADREALAKRSTRSVEAYQLYLNGRQQWRTFSDAGLLASINYYNAALKLDPQFAAAWSGLADAYTVISIWGPMDARTAFPKAQEAARKAVEVDPQSGPAHLSMGAVKLLYERDWEGALRELDAVERVEPTNSDLHTMRGYYFQAMGRTEDALVEIRKARDGAPDWQVTKNDVLDSLIDARRFDEAILEAKKAIALDPSPTTPYGVLGQGHAGKGEYDAAIAALQDAIAHAKENSARHYASLAWSHARAGRREKALELLDIVKKEDSPQTAFAVAKVYAGLGDRDQAFAWLNRAADEKFGFLWDMRNRFEFDILRDDPRYAQLLGRIGLKP